MNPGLVITGCGAVTPAGIGIDALWRAVRDAANLARPLNGPEFEGIPACQAATVPRKVDSLLPFAGSRVASLMALAAEQAIAQARWDRRVLADPATGLCAATSKGDPARLLACRERWLAGQEIGAQDFLLSWPHGPGTMIASRLGMTGPTVCSVAACATGTHALARAAQMVEDGDARRALIVAGDASIVPLLVAAFARMGVLSPDACRPFDRDRNGFVLSEGAAAVALESTDGAIGRPLARLAGWLTGADPTGLADQDATGDALGRAIGLLLPRAALQPRDVALYSAHGTATPSNDRMEARAVRQAFGGHADRLRVIAAKSVVGHLLGAAGLVETIVAIESMRRSVHPPVANLNTPDPDCRVRTVRQAEPADLSAAICTSLGFGGQIGLLALRRARD